MQVITQDNE